ncbi:hypothetical protein AMTRI_Chr11g102220 [Amborella trichopoda]
MGCVCYLVVPCCDLPLTTCPFFSKPSPPSPLLQLPTKFSISFSTSSPFVASAASGSSSSLDDKPKLRKPPSPPHSITLRSIYESCCTWQWRGCYTINFSKIGNGNGAPLLLVHGFGASVGHWRRNMGVLAESYTVFAIDLLGFGASEKPAGFAYTMEAWAELILDFMDEVIGMPTVLIGNSVGSLACVIAASESRKGLVRALVLLNCAGGMNNKAIVDDWRIKILLPLLWLFDFLLKQRGIASALFERVKERENLRNILLSVYGNKESVDDELVEIIKGPADDDGALDAFVSIVTGPPGPNPISLMPRISVPVLVLWGDQDPFTPLDGPVGKYFSVLPSRLSNVSVCVVEGVGHCPHDDRPDLVHEKLLPWLAGLQVP